MIGHPATIQTMLEIGATVVPSPPLPEQCNCLACRLSLKATGSWNDGDSTWWRACRMASCEEKKNSDSALRQHERSHFGSPNNYRCLVHHCAASQKPIGRFGELQRHYKQVHCEVPKKHFCRVTWCKYHKIGFTRRDKLTDHGRNIHNGKPAPGKAMRVLKPAVARRDRSGYKAQDESSDAGQI